MDSTLKQRLIGAAVLAALAIIFLPMLLKGPDVKEPDAAEVPLSMPAPPGQEFETRELTLTAPDGATPPGGVLGMAPGSPPVDADAPAPDSPTVTDEEALAIAPAAEAGAPVAAAPIATPGAKPEAAAPATKPIAAAAVGAGNYVVNVGSFSNLDNATALVAKLRAAKLPVTADRVKLASGTAMRIRVGPYADRAAAEAARLRAESVTGGASKVIALDADPVATVAPKPASTAAAAAPKPAPAAVAKPAAAAAAKPAAAVGFAVQLSAPSVEADALALRDRARASGFSSFVQRVETEAGARFRVRVGPVADRSAAEAMRDAVNGKLGTKGIVVANP